MLIFKKLLLLFILTTLIQALTAQTTFKALQYKPQFPKKGGQLQFTYDPSTTSLKSAADIKAAVYVFTEKGPVVHEPAVTKNTNGKYSASFVLDTNAQAMAFVFSDSAKKDNNDNNGYLLPVYDNKNNIASGANISFASVYNSGDFDIKPQPEKALEYAQKVWQQYPALHNETGYLYFSILQKVKKKEAKPIIEKELFKIEAAPKLSEKDYNFLRDSYKNQGNQKKADSLYAVQKKLYPSGEWKRIEKSEAIYNEEDGAKRLALIEDYLEKKQAKDTLYFKKLAAQTCMRLNRLDKFQELTKDMPLSEKASMVNDVAWQLALKNENLALAKSLSQEVTMWVKNQMNNLSENKPPYQTKKEWQENLTGQYKMYADTYAYILYLMKEYKKGFSYAKEVAVDLAKNQDSNFNNTYTLLLEKNAKPSQVKKEVEDMVQSGNATAKMKELLKAAYIAENKSEKGYNIYFARLEEASDLKKREQLSKEMLDEKAPLFKLVNMEGKQVKMEDLKGKVVVADFWATWCGPCKASFPAMQKAVNKYKNEPNVTFVFIDTWEQAEEREKKVKEFIDKNKYNFNVLYDVAKPDEDNAFTVVSDYKVNGIPTKFIIDKKGTIRFKKVGFDGSDESLVSELSMMIELAAK